MAGITVTPEQLSDASRQLNNGAGQIDAILAQLSSQIAPLQSEWRGAAQASFEALWNEWQSGAKQLHEALTGIATLTQQAAQSYESTESGIATSFAN